MRQHGGVHLTKALSLARCCPSSPRVLSWQGRTELEGHTRKERENSGVSPSESTNPSGSGPTLMTSFFILLQ